MRSLFLALLLFIQSVPRGPAFPHAAAAPTYVTGCSGGAGATGNSTNCSVSISSGNTIVVQTDNYTNGAPNAPTATSGTVTQVGSCATEGSSLYICLYQITGASPGVVTITTTATTGNYLGHIAMVASSGTVDGGTGCSGSTGCSLAGGVSNASTMAGGNVVLTGNNMVFAFSTVAGSATISPGTTPIPLTTGVNASSNYKGFYGSASAGTTNVTVGATPTGSTWYVWTVALH